MRIMRPAIAVVLVMVAPAAADTYPTVHLAVRLAAQHNSVHMETGDPSAWGARYELTLGVQPVELLSIWGVAASSSYRASGLFDGVTRERFSTDVTDEWLGLRALFHPLPYLFLGAGYTKIYTSQDNGREVLESDHASWEIVIGGTVYQTSYLKLQVMFTAGYYERFFGVEENVQFQSFGAGVQF
jgi:hypothetical protein